MTHCLRNAKLILSVSQSNGTLTFSTLKQQQRFIFVHLAIVPVLWTSYGTPPVQKVVYAVRKAVNAIYGGTKA